MVLSKKRTTLPPWRAPGSMWKLRTLLQVVCTSPPRRRRAAWQRERDPSGCPVLPAPVCCCSPQDRKFDKGDAGFVLQPSSQGWARRKRASTFNFRVACLYGSCSKWDRDPSGPGTSLLSGIKNVQWDQKRPGCVST